jgi:hypothetical protein
MGIIDSGTSTGGTVMKKSAGHHTFLKQNSHGISVVELVLVTCILGSLLAGGWILITHLKQRQLVGAGINRVYEIKKAIDQMARECGGYPWRTQTPAKDFGWTGLSRIINPCANNNPVCTVHPIGLPKTYPRDTDCQASNLQKFIPSGLKFTTCATTDANCINNITKNSQKDMNSMFVSDAVTLKCPEPAGAPIVVGWNYSLVVGTTGTPPTHPTSIPVVCANIALGKGKTLTVIVNGGGVIGTDKTVEGSGMIGLDGAALADACPCGAWCKEYGIAGPGSHQGCCKACTCTSTTATCAAGALSPTDLKYKY